MSDYIYTNRFKIEVVFAWLDTYKRILVRFEKLAINFKSWLNLASAMINLRHIFN
ncbi:MAG: transposase [Ferruginibacter sp.]|nr:transposase [Ferruginibacter sp.]